VVLLVESLDLSEVHEVQRFTPPRDFEVKAWMHNVDALSRMAELLTSKGI
jgi:hypothetical protein